MKQKRNLSRVRSPLRKLSLTVPEVAPGDGKTLPAKSSPNPNNSLGTNQVWRSQAFQQYVEFMKQDSSSELDGWQKTFLQELSKVPLEDGLLASTIPYWSRLIGACGFLSSDKLARMSSWTAIEGLLSHKLEPEPKHESYTIYIDEFPLDPEAQWDIVSLEEGLAKIKADKSYHWIELEYMVDPSKEVYEASEDMPVICEWQKMDSSLEPLPVKLSSGCTPEYLAKVEAWEAERKRKKDETGDN